METRAIGQPAVGITVYRPDMSLLGGILTAASQGATRVYLFIDGPTGDAISAGDAALLRADPDRRIIQSERNLGIAAGLNRLAAAAAADGFDRILFFDQDSDVGAPLIGRLDAAFARLAAKNPAAVGPRITAAAGSDTRPPRYRRRAGRSGDLLPVDFVIVSGCLLNLEAWSRVGPFRETLRMDGVDVEWGFRAWASGFSIWMDEASTLPHRVGSGTVRLGPIAFPAQSLGRMVNYVRSQTVCARLAHVPLRWKLRSLVYVPLQIAVFALRSPKPLASAKAMVSAVRDGWTEGRR